jgi:exopolyphosphatase / guanosine-5'-triphosphate,3'-diphosphate pyrophosphatase
MKIAIIDLGSNSFHMIVVQVTKGFHLELLDRRMVLNKLGSYLVRTSSFPENCIRDNAALVAEFCRLAKQHGVEHIGMFATGVFRKMSNTRAFFKEIELATGILPRLLSEEEEISALFEALSVTNRVYSDFLIIDIGGGSSEFILVEGKAMVWARSIPLGSSIMTAMLQDRIGAQDEQEGVIQEIFAAFQPAVVFLETKKIQHCFGTSGVLRSIVLAVDGHAFDKYGRFDAPFVLSYQSVEKVARMLLHREPCNLPDERRDITLIGAVVLKHLMRALSLESLMVSDLSTREGFLFKLGKENKWMFYTE